MPRKVDPGPKQLSRVRKICFALPGVTEKLSHGTPTFFAPKGVFTIFVKNVHGDGRLAVWIPVASGLQSLVIQDAPDVFFKPPYVGVKGWIGAELTRIGDEQLTELIGQAYRIISAKKR